MFEFNPDGSLKIPRKNTGQEILEPEQIVNKLWNGIDFNLTQTLKNMQLIGHLKSKRNYYFVYQHKFIYMVFTGIKDMARFNIVQNDEVDEVYKKIYSYNPFHHKYFTMKELYNFLSEIKFNSRRLELYRTTEDLNKPLNAFYDIILNICYTLVAKGELLIDFEGKSVVFYIRKNNPDKKNDIFSRVNNIGSISEKRVIFKEGKYYYSIQCNNFRGSMVAYLIDEINYLNKLVNEYFLGAKLEIEDLIKKMDYYKRFHDIYNLIMDKNVRNDRDPHQYFYGRIRDALRIVALIYNNIKLEKEGRLFVFYRTMGEIK